MKDLTQQLLDDYRHFIKKSHWEEFKRQRLDDAKVGYGPIVNILDVYSKDGKELLKRIYQRDYEIGSKSGFALEAVRAGVENLNALLENEKPIEQREAV